MNRAGTSSGSPVAPSHDSSHDSLPTAIYFCSICEKPFTNTNSRDRHLRYCGRHARSRPRSCQACNAAKTKCSFASPCTRCANKGILCTYDGLLKAESRALPRSTATAAQNAVAGGSSRVMSTAYATTESSPHIDESMLPSGDLSSFSNISTYVDDTCQDQLNGSNNLQHVNLGSFDALFTSFENDALLSDQYHWPFIELSPPFQHPNSANLQQRPGSWCTWMRNDVSLALVTGSGLSTASNAHYLATQQLVRPHAHHNADLIVQALRAFPTMMLRKETFPWFIHPQSLQQQPYQPPETTTAVASSGAIAISMSIAQMFASRTSETKAFLRQTVKAEYGRFVSEMHHMSKYELLAAMQACMTYLIMYIIDYSPEDQDNARELSLALLDLYHLFKKVNNGCANPTDIPKTRPCWENWIFAESQRRFAALWLLVGCAVCVKNGNVLDTSQSYRDVLLPSPKILWEAPTRSAWEAEYEVYRTYQASGLDTVGDLIDAQQADYTPSNARKLDRWNADVDNLGCLLNLIGSMQ